MSKRGRKYPDLGARLLAATDKSPGFGPGGDCWRFTGHLTHHGYGQIGRGKADGGRVDYAHRVAFEIANGVQLGRAIADRDCVLHRCDNPACVNPAHLFRGDQKLNYADMTQKGRRVSGDQRGLKNPGHKLTEDIVRAVRAANGTYAEIGEEFGLSASWVWKIRNKQAWTHLHD